MCFKLILVLASHSMYQWGFVGVEVSKLDVIAFTSTGETKMHHFCQFSIAAGGQNGDFQTFLDFEKTRALWDLLIVFSKITH